MTVVLDVYRRSLGDEFFDDILLGRTILVAPKMLEKNIKHEKLAPITAVEEIRSSPKSEEIQKTTKEKRRFGRRKKKKR